MRTGAVVAVVGTLVVIVVVVVAGRAMTVHLRMSGVEVSLG